ncbi:hypothetical protein GGR54DRAFT_651442 [Hypoxylon sp. NC1633]|nr:hypothetical protein GGR54DRAFT_651442 [Hypoxylon sp. NC1633]
MNVNNPVKDRATTTLLKQVLDEIDSIFEAARLISSVRPPYASISKIGSINSNLVKAIAARLANKPFEKELPSRALLPAVRYCEPGSTPNAPTAGRLAHLNQTHSAQVEPTSVGFGQLAARSSAQEVSALQRSVGELLSRVPANESTGDPTRDTLVAIHQLEEHCSQVLSTPREEMEDLITLRVKQLRKGLRKEVKEIADAYLTIENFNAWVKDMEDTRSRPNKRRSWGSKTSPASQPTP